MDHGSPCTELTDNVKGEKWEMRENIPLIISSIAALFFLSILPAQVYALTPDQGFDAVKGSTVVTKNLDIDIKGKVKGQGSEGKDQSQSEWLNRAIILEQKKDWQGMLDWCRKWTKSEPKNAEAWYVLGVTYVHLKRHNDASEAYRQTVRINPKHVHAWYNLGIVYGELKRYNDAIEAYRQTVRINPKHVHAWYKIGNVYGELERYNDAVEAYRQTVRIDPKHAKAWYSLGQAYDSLNRYNDAAEAYRQATRVNPKDAEAWNNLGADYNDLSATTMPSKPFVRPHALIQTMSTPG